MQWYSARSSRWGTQASARWSCGVLSTRRTMLCSVDLSTHSCCRTSHTENAALSTQSAQSLIMAGFVHKLFNNRIFEKRLLSEKTFIQFIFVGSYFLGFHFSNFWTIIRNYEFISKIHLFMGYVSQFHWWWAFSVSIRF